jgi:hypothetical protein
LKRLSARARNVRAACFVAAGRAVARKSGLGAELSEQTLEALGLMMIGLAKNGAGTWDFAMRVDIG